MSVVNNGCQDTDVEPFLSKCLITKIISTVLSWNRLTRCSHYFPFKLCPTVLFRVFNPQETPVSRLKRTVDGSKTSCLLHLHADHLYYKRFKSVEAVVAQVTHSNLSPLNTLFLFWLKNTQSGLQWQTSVQSLFHLLQLKRAMSVYRSILSIFKCYNSVFGSSYESQFPDRLV